MGRAPHARGARWGGGGGYGMVWYALRYWEWLAGRSLTLPVFRAGVRGQHAMTWGGGGTSLAMTAAAPGHQEARGARL